MKRTHAVGLLCLQLPLGACADPNPAPVSHEIAKPAPEMRDERPAAIKKQPSAVDITERVREMNVEGREPPLPTRRGTATPLRQRPNVERTDKGFVAHLPGATNVVTPAYHDGNILVAGDHAYEIYALSAETGRTQWALKLSDDGPTPPACEGETCVFNTYSCTLYSVDANTGEHLWNWWLGSPQLATPLIEGDLVYTSYPDESGPPDARFVLAAFDLRTGEPKWRRWIDAEINSTPVAHAGKIALATQAGTFYEFDATSGAVLGAFRNRIASPPVFAAGGVHFQTDHTVSPDNRLAAAASLLPQIGGPGYLDQVVVAKPRPLAVGQRLVTVDRGVLVATDSTTGKRLWTRRVGEVGAAAVSAPLLTAGKSILMATGGGNVMELSAESGAIKSIIDLGQGPLAYPPIAMHGWIYAGTQAGTVVAYDTGDPELTGWPMLGGGPARTGIADPEAS